MHDKNELLEEILSHISLLLSETRSYLGGEVSEKEYNKMKFIPDQIREMENLFTEYKNVDAKTIDKIRYIIEPLKKINYNTAIVVIEKLLLRMTESIMNEMGHDVKIHDVNEDDLVEEQQDLFNIFRQYPTTNYELLIDIRNGDARVSKLKNLRVSFENKVRPEFNKSMEDPLSVNDNDFQDFVEHKLRLAFNQLWDEQFEELMKQELAQQSVDARHRARNLKERIVTRFIECKVRPSKSR